LAQGLPPAPSRGPPLLKMQPAEEEEFEDPAARARRSLVRSEAEPEPRGLPTSWSKLSVCETASTGCSTAAPDLDDLEPCLCPDSPLMCTPRALPKSRPTPAACLSMAASSPSTHEVGAESEDERAETMEDPAARARRSLVRA